MNDVIKELKKYEIDVQGFEFILDNKDFREGNKIHYTKVNRALYMAVFEQDNVTVEARKGIMLDISRGRVYKVEEIKKLIAQQACMGMDYLELYMEDLVPLDNYPMFGYLRGGYSREELIDLVAYSRKFDIELIACVQALGHLENYLRWPEVANVKDTSEVLALHHPETYVFLEELFTTVKEIFDTDKIHIGMDEAFSMGLGTRFRETGEINQKQQFKDHLSKIEKMCKTIGFNEIQIWSDMLFSVNTGTDAGGLYNYNFENPEPVSNNFKLFYWNYWAQQKETYDILLDKHFEFNNNIGMAIGVHIWSELFYNEHLIEASRQAFKSSLEKGIDDIMLTMWNDDGGICNFESIKYGIYKTMCALYQIEENKHVFENIFGLELETFKITSKFAIEQLEVLNVLWDDPINQLYKKTFTAQEIQSAITELKSKQRFSIPTGQVQVMYEAYFNYLIKSLENYNSSKLIVEDIEIEAKYFAEIVKLIESEWLVNSKLEGFEIIQNRLTCKMMRYDFLIRNYDNIDIHNLRAELCRGSYKIVDRHYPKVAYVNTNKW